MVWPHPEQEGMYIVVSGVSERRLDDWFPNRILIKRFDELRPEGENKAEVEKEKEKDRKKEKENKDNK
jgi:hypothetical protein